MDRYYFKSSFDTFVKSPPTEILGRLTQQQAAAESQQHVAWRVQIELLQNSLRDLSGAIIFEYSIPRMGKRVDCIIIIEDRVYVIEFKVGAAQYDRYAIDQAIDYALDLKNFHEESHAIALIPVLICTAAHNSNITFDFHTDGVAQPILSNGSNLAEILIKPLQIPTHIIDIERWLNSRYKPTPTIIEAAQALYRGHAVEDISRSDSGTINLSLTNKAICEIIERSKVHTQKSICFVTGVPGAGKTLAGLNLANAWHDTSNEEHAVFLSGNGPLVDVLREALARDQVETGKQKGTLIKKSAASTQTKAFIQNIHHFRDAALLDQTAPIERVVIFDEAQRAWTLDHTVKFMRTKKGHTSFNQSEPDFLIGVLDRHPDWATVVCLIGGGQEINTGEAGLQEWLVALSASYPHWNIYISSRLHEAEYALGLDTKTLAALKIHKHDDLHLAVSVRSFRSERVALFIKQLLDNEIEAARVTLCDVLRNYPIYLTRDIHKAKNWIQEQARGNERTGMLASSGAMRLKPYAIQVKSPVDPVNWFLNDKADIRSSNFLEDVATEFMIQGLELDWTCVAWDADLRHDGISWQSKAFRGTKWQDVKNEDARRYLKNAYRVLLTRARQGMIIFVPYGSIDDATRKPEFYDHTYEYLRDLGLPVI